MEYYQKLFMMINVLALTVDIVLLWWLIFKHNCENVKSVMLVGLAVLTTFRLTSLVIAAHLIGIS